MTLAEKIKIRRDEFNWTQSDLAEVSGLNRWTIVQCENGNSKPRAETLQKLADALDIDVSILADDNVDLHTEDELLDVYAQRIKENYGEKASNGFVKTIKQSGYFFAGGILPTNDKEKYIAAVADTYMKFCKMSIQKYGRIVDEEDKLDGGES